MTKLKEFKTIIFYVVVLIVTVFVTRITCTYSKEFLSLRQAYASYYNVPVSNVILSYNSKEPDIRYAYECIVLKSGKKEYEYIQSSSVQSIIKNEYKAMMKRNARNLIMSFIISTVAILIIKVKKIFKEVRQGNLE